MLTQGPARDPKFKLIISFLRLPHFLDCLIPTRNTMSIVLLELMWGWDRRGWLIYIRFCLGVWGGRVGGRGWVSSYSLFFFFHVLLYFFASRFQSLYLGG